MADLSEGSRNQSGGPPGTSWRDLFPTHIFWDCEPDLVRHRDFVIERVLELGDVTELVTLGKLYPEVKKEAEASMHPEVVSANGRVAADLLAGRLSQEAVLAGGTAVALYLGHRDSDDLDFFLPPTGPTVGEVLSEVRDLVQGKISQRPKSAVFLINETKISLTVFPTETLFGATELWQGLRLANMEDLSIMKLYAILDRGSVKDWIDLYAICHSGYFGLQDILIRTAQVLPFLNPMSLVRGLKPPANPNQPWPRMRRPLKWEEVVSFFVEAEETITQKVLKGQLQL